MKSSLFEKTRLIRLTTIATLCALLVTTSLLVICNKRIETLKHEVWKTFPLNSPTDSSSVVNFLAFDDNDQLWIATNRAGLKVLSPEGKLTSYTIENSELISDSITALAIDNQDRVWIGTDQGLNMLAPNGDWATHTKENSALEHDWVSALVIDPKNRVWVITGYDLYVLSPDGGWQTITPPYKPRDVGQAIAMDSDGRIWIGGYRSYIVDTNGKWKSFDINIDNIHDMAIDKQNRVWVSTSYGGDVIMIGTDDKLKSYQGRNSDYTGSIAVDHKMQVWFAGEYRNSGPFFGGATENYIGMLTPDGQWKSISLKSSGLSESRLDFVIAIDRQERIWVGHVDSVSVADPNLLQTQMDLSMGLSNEATLLKWSSIFLAVVLVTLTIKGLPATIRNRVFRSGAIQMDNKEKLWLIIFIGSIVLSLVSAFWAFYMWAILALGGWLLGGTAYILYIIAFLYIMPIHPLLVIICPIRSWYLHKKNQHTKAIQWAVAPIIGLLIATLLFLLASANF